jgi:hypothetical protein
MYQDILIKYNIEKYVLPLIFGLFIGVFSYIFCSIENINNYLINPFMVLSIVVGIYIYRMQSEYQENYDRLVRILQRRMNKIRLKMSDLNIKKCKQIFEDRTNKTTQK